MSSENGNAYARALKLGENAREIRFRSAYMTDDIAEKKQAQMKNSSVSEKEKKRMSCLHKRKSFFWGNHENILGIIVIDMKAADAARLASLA